MDICIKIWMCAQFSQMSLPTNLFIFIPQNKKWIKKKNTNDRNFHLLNILYKKSIHYKRLKNAKSRHTFDCNCQFICPNEGSTTSRFIDWSLERQEILSQTDGVGSRCWRFIQMRYCFYIGLYQALVIHREMLKREKMHWFHVRGGLVCLITLSFNHIRKAKSMMMSCYLMANQEHLA